jgi:hypothetical protein
LDEVSALYEKIATSDIDTGLRSLMLDQLETIRRAIHEYRVAGIQGLRQAVADGALIIAGNVDRFQTASKAYTEKHGEDSVGSDSILNDPIAGYVSLISSLGTIMMWEWKAFDAIAPVIQHLLSK